MQFLEYSIAFIGNFSRLGWHAFYIILKKRKTCHFRLLQMLRQKEQTVSISRGVSDLILDVFDTLLKHMFVIRLKLRLVR